MFTISDLKKHLGPGLGLRKNKYLLEIPVPGIAGDKINVLARSAGLPERNMTTASVFHKGRKYNMRGETDYVGAYEVSILDDSSMEIRKKFDEWMIRVDNSKPKNNGIFSGASYEQGVGSILGAIKSGIGVANQIKNVLEDPKEAIGGFFLGMVDQGSATSIAKYQTDINVWQLSASGDKVYGYKLQNAFPSSIGIVTLDDGDENTLSEFSIVFTYSEFEPLVNVNLSDRLQDVLLGDDIKDIRHGIEALVE